MIFFLKLDYNRFRISLIKLYKPNSSISALLAMFIIHCIQLVLLYFMSDLLALKIFICTMATIALIVSCVFIEPDQINQQIMCIQFVLFTCQVIYILNFAVIQVQIMVLFGNEYAILHFLIWMAIFQMLSIKLGIKDQKIKQGANILKSGLNDDAFNQVDFSYYSNGSVTHDQIELYVKCLDLVFRTALIAALALTPILPRNLLLAIDIFDLGQYFVSFVCKVMLYELACYKRSKQGFFRSRLRQTMPQEIIELLQKLIEYIIFSAFFTMLNIFKFYSILTKQLIILQSIVAVALAKTIFHYLSKHIHQIFVHIMLLTIFQLLSGIGARYLVSSQTSDKFFFKLYNLLELVTFAVLYSICWRPPKFILHFRNIIRLLLFFTYLIQPLYYIGKLLVSDDYSSIAFFIQHDMKFIIYRKLLFYILLTLFLLILEANIDEESLAENTKTIKIKQAQEKSVERMQNLKKEINQYECYIDYFLENIARLFQRSEEINLINMKQYQEFLAYIGDSVRVTLFFIALFNLNQNWQFGQKFNNLYPLQATYTMPLYFTTQLSMIQKLNYLRILSWRFEPKNSQIRVLQTVKLKLEFLFNDHNVNYIWNIFQTVLLRILGCQQLIINTLYIQLHAQGLSINFPNMIFKFLMPSQYKKLLDYAYNQSNITNQEIDYFIPLQLLFLFAIILPALYCVAKQTFNRGNIYTQRLIVSVFLAFLKFFQISYLNQIFNTPLQLFVLFFTDIESLFTISFMLLLIESYISLKILIESDSLNQYGQDQYQNSNQNGIRKRIQASTTVADSLTMLGGGMTNGISTLYSNVTRNY